MAKIRFSTKQVEELLRNVNVLRCNQKTLTYSDDFKIKSVEQFNSQGLAASIIFQNAGFDYKIFGLLLPSDCLTRWRKKYRLKGSNGLIESRGKNVHKTKNEDLSNEDRIERLEIENAYLKAENDFLAKLRAKRRE